MSAITIRAGKARLNALTGFPFLNGCNVLSKINPMRRATPVDEIMVVAAQERAPCDFVLHVRVHSQVQLFVPIVWRLAVVAALRPSGDEIMVIAAHERVPLHLGGHIRIEPEV